MTAMDPGAGDAAHEHGGDLAAARRRFPGAPEPFVDLSTGINPHAYPLLPLPPESFARLPEPADIEHLAAAAAKAYGAPSAAHVVAAPGAQMLLPFVMRLRPPGRAAVLSPTYSEHRHAAALAGHDVTEISEIARLAEADLAVVVNPNNPDGRLIDTGVLRRLAAGLAARGGLLVVDEAFMDVGPPEASLAPGSSEHLVVLRSFGKFFGLAGLRLGFTLTGPRSAMLLREALGPWAVSGPAIAIGTAALSDKAWIETTREHLKKSAQRLDGLLADAGLTVIGGTSLYRLAQTPRAAELFERLGRAGILVRRFSYERSWLRFGLPRDETEWERLRAVLFAKREG